MWREQNLIVVDSDDLSLFTRLNDGEAWMDSITEGDLVWTADTDFSVTSMRLELINPEAAEFKSWHLLGTRYTYRTGSLQGAIEFSNRIFSLASRGLRHTLYSDGVTPGERELYLKIVRGLPLADYRDALRMEALYCFRADDLDAFDLIAAEAVDAGFYDSRDAFVSAVRHDDSWSAINRAPVARTANQIQHKTGRSDYYYLNSLLLFMLNENSDEEIDDVLRQWARKMRPNSAVLRAMHSSRENEIGSGRERQQ
ncbi:hypothetical protein CGZ94_20230 [Enemella evansiae]|uniref:Uncharacterized protein n=1 Tax=Enemella evansiae TaxID=2016499 RepID=A0A255G371_9ACTN|nr:hypothetical protein CGZ94_20230 [Enemella evansiae]